MPINRPGTSTRLLSLVKSHRSVGARSPNGLLQLLSPHLPSHRQDAGHSKHGRPRMELPVSLLSLQVLVALHAQRPSHRLQVSRHKLLLRHFSFLFSFNIPLPKPTCSLYAPLLGDTKKEYIRNFAAESFAFIMRKMADKESLFDFLLDRLHAHPEVSRPSTFTHC